MCLSAAGRIVSVDGTRAEAIVDIEGTGRAVSLAVLALEGRLPAPGDWVVVHTGFAVEILDPRAVTELETLREDMRKGGARAREA